MPQTNYAVRLRAPYDTLRQTVSDWTVKASRVVVYEHPEVGNIHCHVLLMGVYDSEQTLKNIMQRHGVGLKGAGQLSFKTSFKSPDRVKLDITEESALKFITYMSKGKYEPKYNTGYTQETIDLCKSQWVIYSKRSPDQTLYDSFEKYVREQEKKFGIAADEKMVRSMALRHAKEKYGVINLGCRRDTAMLVDTYCYDNLMKKDIRLPFDK